MPERIADLYYRRTMWLIAFGVLHAYCLWPGDILYSYGVTGLLLFALRKVAPKALIAAGLVLLAVFSVKTFRQGWQLRELRDKATEATVTLTAGRTPTPEQLAASERWTEQVRQEKPDAATITEMIHSRRAGYWQSFAFRSARASETQSVEFYQREFWDVGGMMLIGMGLFQLGFFSANRPFREYVWVAVVGYAIGLLLGLYFLTQNIKANFDPADRILLSSGYQLVRLSVALAHVAVLALLYQSAILSGLRTRLAAIGQTALSNYILHSVVCTFVFYGYGLALYGSLQRWQYYLVALGIWTFQLTTSKWWLQHFRFGP